MNCSSAASNPSLMRPTAWLRVTPSRRKTSRCTSAGLAPGGRVRVEDVGRAREAEPARTGRGRCRRTPAGGWRGSPRRRSRDSTSANEPSARRTGWRTVIASPGPTPRSVAAFARQDEARSPRSAGRTPRSSASTPRARGRRGRASRSRSSPPPVRERGDRKPQAGVDRPPPTARRGSRRPPPSRSAGTCRAGRAPGRGRPWRTRLPRRSIVRPKLSSIPSTATSAVMAAPTLTAVRMVRRGVRSRLRSGIRVRLDPGRRTRAGPVGQAAGARDQVPGADRRDRLDAHAPARPGSRWRSAVSRARAAAALP